MFDLDDTIVQSGSYVSPRVISALARARKEGYVLCIASGRPLCSLHEELVNSGLMDYAVCSNGAVVARLQNGDKVCHSPLSADDALACYNLLRKYHPAWNGFWGNDAYFEWKSASYMLTGRTGAIARSARSATGHTSLPAKVVRLARRGVAYVARMASNSHHHQVLSLYKHLLAASDGVDKMGCTFFSSASCDRAEATLREDGRFEVARMGRTELEVTARGVNKGTGALALMERLGTSPADAVSFGDGANDLPLARVVGRFVAVENAEPAAKAAATFVCPSVSDDGVAVWMEQNLW